MIAYVVYLGPDGDKKLYIRSGGEMLAAIDFDALGITAGLVSLYLSGKRKVHFPRVDQSRAIIDAYKAAERLGVVAT